jgi:hypothetical protein
VEIFGGLLGLLSPLVALWAGLFIGRRPLDPVSDRPVLLLFIAPIIATMIAALFTHPEANWSTLASPLAAVLALEAIDLKLNIQPARRLFHIALTGTTALLFTLIIHVHAMRPFLPLPPRTDPVSRLMGWQDADALTSGAPDAAAVVCDNYGLASMLRWDGRFSTSPVPVHSTDRSVSIPPGPWIILDQIGDPGNYATRFTCETVSPPTKVPLYRGDGEVVRTVTRREGTGCAAR